MMRPTQALLKSGRSAWKGEDFLHVCVLDLYIHNNTYTFCFFFFFKGPYFVPFHLSEALANHTPIRTQARSCTILPTFVGYV